MSNSAVFISHASIDKNFVLKLDQQLKSHNISTWIDCSELIASVQLNAKIKKAIKNAKYFIVVISLKTINSDWVKKEIKYARKAAKKNKKYKIIPILLDDVKPNALQSYKLGKEPLGIKIQLKVGQLQEKMPDILAALDKRLPTLNQGGKVIQNKPLAELLLKLSRPTVKKQDNNLEQWQGEARLIYTPSDSTVRPIESDAFYFNAPINEIELDDLRWYLERYYTWPSKLAQQRARTFEKDLIEWGKALYQAAFNQTVGQTAIQAWQNNKADQRYFSVQIDSHLMNGKEDQEAQKIANQVATKLMSLPWELLHNDQQFLINNGLNPIHIRRRLPNYQVHQAYLLALPIRILVISPRPEDAGYIDHRVSAKPLLEAVETLGSLIEVDLLQPPTYTALAKALKKAMENEKPYHVVHFDGHGVYDPKHGEHGSGALCFEDHQDRNKITDRKMELIHADKLAPLLKDYRIPLVFLEACQTAQSEFDPNASVAASLLKEGVASVIAMSHSVLVKTASLFVAEFYQQLALGQSVGAAMLAGQTILQQDPFRLNIAGAGKFNLIDWFVPILYQEQLDPQLFKQIPNQQAQKHIKQGQQTQLGDLPAEPEHHFIGRSYPLLQAERLLQQNNYVLIKGQGGIGKSTLAEELCRWLVQTSRYQAVAFISLEEYSATHGIIDSLGKQLVEKEFSVAALGENTALLEIKRQLELKPILILADNMESLTDGQSLQTILSFFNFLLNSEPKTRLILTSRESLPAPFAQKPLTLGELSKDEAKQLIFNIAAQQGRTLEDDKDGYNHSLIDQLIQQIGGHARALTLLAKELVISDNMTATRNNLTQIIKNLDQKYPNQRERSLFASLELSLKRLSPQSREWVKGLAVFYQGGHFHVISEVLTLNSEEADLFCNELVQAGLAEKKDHDYFLFDPALTVYLDQALTAQQKTVFLERWFKVMAELLDYLVQQHSKDSTLSVQLTLLDLANLMAFIRQLPQQIESNSAENIVTQARSLEQLLAPLNQKQALNKVIKIRTKAALKLDQWNHAAFENKWMNIERLQQQGDLINALKAAKSLLKQSQQAEKQAYQEADYDLAMAYVLVGRLLKFNGKTQIALEHLKQAELAFKALEQDAAKQMAALCLIEQADCLSDLGLYDDAIKTYQKSIKLAKTRNDQRGIAVTEGQLATVYLHQKEFKKALTAYQKALALFKTLNEPLSIATAYHQMAMVYQDLNQFEAAEQSYLKSLKIKSQQHDLAGEAGSLGNLALLYQEWKKPAQAIKYCQQAINCYLQLKDKAGEGGQRSNLANLFLSLKDFKKARPEILQAIECLKDFGFSATHWKAYDILFQIEQAENNQPAAQQARQNALDSFLSYRQAGGENHAGEGRLALAVLSAISEQNTAEISETLTAVIAEHKDPDKQAFVTALQAIIAGSRDLQLADNPVLNFQQVVELRLLLAAL